MNWYIRLAADMANADPNKPPSWQFFDRQRQFPFMGQPDNPYRTKFKEDDAEMYGYEKDHPVMMGGNLYHVTTNLSGVLKDLRLKSRTELGGDTSGLGGGARNEAPNMISCTYDYNRALHIYEELHLVAGVVSGRIPASQIYRHFSSYTDNVFDEFTAFDRVIRDHGVPKQIIMKGDDNQIGAILDQKVVTPEDRYSFLQACETAILKQEQGDNEFSESPYEQSVIGFTMDFYSMRNLNPKQIAIIQCAYRKNAVLEPVYNEQEVRVSPADLAIVRYLQPNVTF